MPVDFSLISMSQRQDMIAVLTMCEGAGLTDSRFIRQQLAESLRAETGMYRTEAAASRMAARAAGGTVAVVGDGRRKMREVVRAPAACPVCGSAAVAERVNVCKSTFVGGPWRSSISCTDPDCLHIEYSRLTVKQLLHKGVR